ncbi:VOC family protein [Granulicella sp. S190]|uniref:VOC family protein n=1 Tax=Granulicella sp. S190 TaxID=1747226 RepID=UPI00131E97ED|nr:VOC family protein [Granulicella sp. S190]
MVTGLNHITLSVNDLDRAFGFYTSVLGLRPVARWYKGAYLAAGDLWLCLSLEKDIPNRSLNPTYDHVAFSVSEKDFHPLCSRIVTAGAKLWQENHSEGDSLYFLDHDGHRLEIHVSNLESRIEALKQHPPKELVFYDPPD